MADTWPTAITEIKPNEVRVRGYNIADLMGRVTFGQAVYLVLRGEMPSDKVGRLMDAILVSSIDHGVTPPSVQSARQVASTGATVSASVAAGIMSINEFHGGAITNCALQLSSIIERAGKDGDLIAAASAFLDELKSKGKRMSGFGHRVHSNDPRTSRLFELAEEAGVSGSHMAAADAVAEIFAGSGKTLPLNVDGAIAAVTADLGFEPQIMNGLFMIARTPGLLAHVAEEQDRMRPMRRIDPKSHTYDGPKTRTL